MKKILLTMALVVMSKVALASELPSGFYQVADTLAEASLDTGVAVEHLATFAAIESTFRTGVKNDQSTATGLFQFTTPTWRTMLKRYGKQYGLSLNASRKDPLANTLMGAEYLKENQRIMEARLGRKARLEEVYMAHLLSPRRAVKVLRTPSHHNLAAMFPDIAERNRTLFYHRPGHPKSAGQFIATVRNKVENAFFTYAGHAKTARVKYIAQLNEQKERIQKAVDSMPFSCDAELTATQKLVAAQMSKYKSDMRVESCGNDPSNVAALRPFIVNRKIV